MKKVFFLAAALILAAACSESGDCVIKGSVPGDVDTISLINHEEVVLDSCYVLNGKFRFTCERQKEAPVAIVMDKYSDPVPLIPDSGTITVKIGGKNAKISGSKRSRQLNELQNWAINLYMKTSGELEKLFEAKDYAAAEAFVDKRDADIVKHCKPIFKAHKDDYVGVQAMVLMYNKLDKDEFISLYESAAPCVQNDFRLVGYYKTVKK